MHSADSGDVVRSETKRKGYELVKWQIQKALVGTKFISDWMERSLGRHLCEAFTSLPSLLVLSVLVLRK
jgi:hypothetical protein